MTPANVNAAIVSRAVRLGHGSQWHRPVSVVGFTVQTACGRSERLSNVQVSTDGRVSCQSCARKDGYR